MAKDPCDYEKMHTGCRREGTLNDNEIVKSFKPEPADKLTPKCSLLRAECVKKSYDGTPTSAAHEYQIHMSPGVSGMAGFG